MKVNGFTLYSHGFLLMLGILLMAAGGCGGGGAGVSDNGGGFGAGFYGGSDSTSAVKSDSDTASGEKGGFISTAAGSGATTGGFGSSGTTGGFGGSSATTGGFGGSGATTGGSGGTCTTTGGYGGGSTGLGGGFGSTGSSGGFGSGGFGGTGSSGGFGSGGFGGSSGSSGFGSGSFGGSSGSSGFGSGGFGSTGSSGFGGSSLAGSGSGTNGFGGGSTGGFSGSSTTGGFGGGSTTGGFSSGGTTGGFGGYGGGTTGGLGGGFSGGGTTSTTTSTTTTPVATTPVTATPVATTPVTTTPATQVTFPEVPIAGLNSLVFNGTTSSTTIKNFAPTGRAGLIIFSSSAGVAKNSFRYSASLSSGRGGSGKGTPAPSYMPGSTIFSPPCMTSCLIPASLPREKRDLGGFARASGVQGRGGSATFYMDAAPGKSVTATARKDGSFCTLYVQESEWGQGKMNDTTMAECQAFFDSALPVMRQIFGQDQPVGANGDSRFTILFNAYASQFSFVDMFSRNDYSASNERKILYVSSKCTVRELKTVMIHELEHAIHQYQKYSQAGRAEESWLTECMAITASELLGVPDSWIDTFLSKPYDSLTTFNGATSDYAACCMFGRYLIRQYTGGICHKIVNSPSTGIDAVTAALKGSGYYDSFYEAFQKWAAANYLNSYQGKNSSMGYPAATYQYSGGSVALSAVNLEDNPLRTLLKRTISSYPVSETDNDYPCPSTLEPWSATYFEFTGGDGSDLTFTITKSGNDGGTLRGFYVVK